MSRTIQRLAAFVILSSILISGCAARGVTVSGLHAVAAVEGVNSTLNFKLRNPTRSEIVLTGIEFKPYEKGDANGDGKLDQYIYEYVAEFHHIQTTDQGRKDEVVKEVRLPAGRIIEFKPDGEYYVKLVYKKLDKPPAEPQKGLQHNFLMWAVFSLANVSAPTGEPPKETRTAIGFPWQEVYIK